MMTPLLLNVDSQSNPTLVQVHIKHAQLTVVAGVHFKSKHFE